MALLGNGEGLGVGWLGARKRGGPILRVSPRRAASARMASWALSRVSLAGRLFAGVKVMKQQVQTSMLSGLPVHRRHAVRSGFL